MPRHGLEAGVDPTAPLTADDLRAVGLVADQLAAERVGLWRGASATAKWHVPRDRWQPCQHSRAEPNAVVGVLDGLRLCTNCTRLPLAAPAQAYLAVARRLVAAHAWVVQLEAQASTLTWLDWARRVHGPDRLDPSGPGEVLAPLDEDQCWTESARSARTVWADLVARTDTALAVGRVAAAAADAQIPVKEAGNALVADRACRSEAERLERAVGVAVAQPHSYQRYEVPTLVAAAAAWQRAVLAGQEDLAAEQMQAAVLQLVAGEPVRDLTALPPAAATDRDAHDSVHAWALAEYDVLRERTVDAWHARVRRMFAEIADRAPGEDVLLRVLGWPLTHDSDRPLAYLTQFPVLAEVEIPHLKHWRPAPEPQRAVVLHAPAWAGAHAGAYERISVGATVPTGQAPNLHAARGMLRPLVPFLPADALDDLGNRPSTRVVAARRERLAGSSRLERRLLLAPHESSRGRSHLERTPEEEAASEAFSRLRGWTYREQPFVPGTHDERLLATIVANAYRPVRVRMEVETGPADDRKLVALLGEVGAVDLDQDTVLLTLDNTEQPVPVPFRRVVAIYPTR